MIFENWQHARKAARKAQGPVTGYIESMHERGRYYVAVCGARFGQTIGESICGSELFK